LHKEIANPHSEVEQIFIHFLHLSNRTELYLRMQNQMKESEWESIKEAVERRKTGEPLQYILGIAYFWNVVFNVNPSVLIPRPETELLVEYASTHLTHVKKILDIGTGSGCIAIALRKENPNFEIDAVDISQKALDLAAKNADKNQVNIHFFQSDVFSNVNKKYDLIISNPPYISSLNYDELPLEIKNYEPKEALLAADNGIHLYKKILAQADSFLNDNGVVLFEIGAEQGEMIKELAIKNGFTEMRIGKDLNGFDRIIIIKR
jgi:release factor glutamine methyltransferase